MSAAAAAAPVVDGYFVAGAAAAAAAAAVGAAADECSHPVEPSGALPILTADSKSVMASKGQPLVPLLMIARMPLVLSNSSLESS